MPCRVDPALLPLLASGDQGVPRDAADARRALPGAPLRPRVAVSSVEDVDAGGVPARCYDPRAVPRVGPVLPAVVWVHGGGFVTGSVDTADDVCRAIADRAPAVVVSVEYRLAPEHPYPAGLDDVVQVVEFVCAAAVDLGVDPARVAVGGTSAGATLAAAACLRARRLGAPSIAAQVLVHPCVDDALETPSAHEHAVGYGLTRAKMAWYWAQYLPVGRAADPEAVPGRADDLRGLPPALVSLAACDIMRDEGLEYARRLRGAAVAARTRVWPGMLHGFLAHPALTPVADAAIDEIAAFVAQG